MTVSDKKFLFVILQKYANIYQEMIILVTSNKWIFFWKIRLFMISFKVDLIPIRTRN